MDFIVLGGVLGAVLMVVGTVLRDVLPRRLRIAGDDTPWVDVRDRRRTVRSALVGGRTATIVGGLVLLATALLVVTSAPDAISLAVVVGLAMVGIVACLGWVFWYRYQESSGAIQRRQMRVIAARLGPATGTPIAGPRRDRDEVADLSGSGQPARRARQQRRPAPDWGERGPARNGRENAESDRRPGLRDDEGARPVRRTAAGSVQREPESDRRPGTPRTYRAASAQPPDQDIRHRPAPPASPDRTAVEVPSLDRPHRAKSGPTANPPRS